MGEPNARAPDAGPPDRAEPRAGYRVEVLREARPCPHGILHRSQGRERLLRWEEVRFAVAAEVGEPEGVRAIVFDLVLGRDEEGWRVARLDADPGPDALAFAQAIHAGVAPPRRGPSIKSIASDGVASWWHADLESFEAAVAAVIRARDP